MPQESVRCARVEARLAPETLAVIKQAAELQGRSVSDFVVAAAQEAVQLSRRLAAVNPAAFEPILATALDGVARCMSELERREEALAASLEAVEIFRRLATADRRRRNQRIRFARRRQTGTLSWRSRQRCSLHRSGRASALGCVL